jgi:hypothetical protein
MRFEDCEVYDFSDIISTIQNILTDCINFNLQSLKRRELNLKTLPKEFAITELQKQIQNNLDSFNTFTQTKRNVYSPDGVAAVFNDTNIGFVEPTYPTAGTLLSTMCKGYDQYGLYANGNGGSVDVKFFGDVITIGALSQGFEIKNIVKSIVIEYKVLWAERKQDKRYQIDLDDLKKSIGALKEIPNMIDGLAVGEEIRINIGDLSIRFGNSMQGEEQISFGDNGYYINVDSYQHNAGESAQSLKEFASGFADFLTQLVAKAEEVEVKVTTSTNQATSK